MTPEQIIKEIFEDHQGYFYTELEKIIKCHKKLYDEDEFYYDTQIENHENILVEVEKDLSIKNWWDSNSGVKSATFVYGGWEYENYFDRIYRDVEDLFIKICEEKYKISHDEFELLWELDLTSDLYSLISEELLKTE